jgi:hypothetical protein
MTETITVTPKELEAALRATKRTGPVLSAHKQGGYIILHLCGDKEPVRWKPKAPKKKPARAAAGGASKPKTFAEG